MKFDFFTFGGGQFWEDVFFYQKWRIQRNCESKKYRLLDNWDIRRFEGTFDECRKAFVGCIETYEISRQKGHMIIMLHGLGETKNIFKPLWRRALEDGYMAAAINYPSTRKNIDSHVRQLNFLLNNLEDVGEVSFVTKGAGGIVLKKLLNVTAPWKEKLKINKIIMINSPEKGSLLFEKLDKYRFFRFLLGPMLKEISPENIKNVPNIPKNAKCGVIKCSPFWGEFARLLPKKWSSILISDEDCSEDCEKISIRNSNFNFFDNRKMTNSIINFVRKGKF